MGCQGASRELPSSDTGEAVSAKPGKLREFHEIPKEAREALFAIGTAGRSWISASRLTESARKGADHLIIMSMATMVVEPRFYALTEPGRKLRNSLCDRCWKCGTYIPSSNMTGLCMSCQTAPCGKGDA